MSRLRFLHIPKTAGSTFAAILRHQYRYRGHFDFTGDDNLDHARFMAIPESERAWIGLFTGHAPITSGIPEADDATIITFVREPVSRVQSFCQYVSEGKISYLKTRFPSDNFDLDGFLESQHGELFNLQTKMLINHKTSHLSVLIDSMSASEARDKALENLFGKVTQYGLQEYFDESLFIFRESLNWSIPSYKSVNQKDESRLIEFKQRHLDRIAELNSIDIEVYDAARKLFLETLATRNITDLELREFKIVLKTAASDSEKIAPKNNPAH